MLHKKSRLLVLRSDTSCVMSSVAATSFDKCEEVIGLFHLVDLTFVTDVFYFSKYLTKKS